MFYEIATGSATRRSIGSCRRGGQVFDNANKGNRTGVIPPEAIPNSNLPGSGVASSEHQKGDAII